MEDKTFELLEKMYSEFVDFKEDTNSRLNELKNHVVKMEYDLKKDISALYDGYEQNSQKLDRIEKAVIRHEDIIIKKVK